MLQVEAPPPPPEEAISTRGKTQLQDAGTSMPSGGCDHCGLPVPRGLIDASSDKQFCCAACKTVYATIHACGLEGYYKLRDQASANDGFTEASTSGGVFASGGRYGAFDHGDFWAANVEVQGDARASVRFALQGVHCAACLWLIEKLPRVVVGVIESRLSLRTATVQITFDPKRVPISKIAQSLSNLGYPPSPAQGGDQDEAYRRYVRKRMLHLAIAGACAGNTMMIAIALYAGWFSGIADEYRQLFRWVSMGIALVALTWPGAAFFRGAWSAMRARTVNLDVPIALALGVGTVAGVVNVVLDRGEIYFDSLTVLVFLLLVGRFIQQAQIRRAQDAINLLHALIPTTARLVEASGRVVDVPASSLSEGDLVEVCAGDVIPADGVIAAGHSAVDEKLLTGESLPLEVKLGDRVLAGCENKGGILRVRVSAAGGATRAGKLMALVESHLKDKTPVQQLADKIAGYFVVVLSVIALGVFAGWSAVDLSLAVDHTVALLIVACPCALGLATPLTLAMAIATAARRKILIKGASVLQHIAKVKPERDSSGGGGCLASGGGRVVFDKTGTLTEGQLTLTRFEGEEAVKPLIVAIERRSLHPIARALVRSLQEHAEAADAIDLQDVCDHGQGGVEARVDGRTVRIGTRSFACGRGDIEAWQDDSTPVYLSIDGECRAVMGLADWLRPEAPRVTRRLATEGWQPCILSGDDHRVVERIADEAGIDQDQRFARQLPEDKLRRIKQWKQEGALMMVGDGVNDAPALAAADISVAVHLSAEASLAAADVCIARPGLDALPELVQISKNAMRATKRNLVVSLGYNTVAVTLAACGLLHPLTAAVLMPLSSVTILTLAATSQRRLTSRIKP